MKAKAGSPQLALAGPLLFLVWSWISTIMVLLGAEFNAGLERGRAIGAGHPEAREPFVEARDTRKWRVQRAGVTPEPGR